MKSSLQYLQLLFLYLEANIGQIEGCINIEVYSCLVSIAFCYGAISLAQLERVPGHTNK